MSHRQISANEAAVVRWLLANASTGSVRPGSDEIDGLVVIGGCSCGCASIDFEAEADSARASIVADALAVWPDGMSAGRDCVGAR
jgi:hypothetical protein